MSRLVWMVVNAALWFSAGYLWGRPNSWERRKIAYCEANVCLYDWERAKILDGVKP